MSLQPPCNDKHSPAQCTEHLPLGLQGALPLGLLEKAMQSLSAVPERLWWLRSTESNAAPVVLLQSGLCSYNVQFNNRILTCQLKSFAISDFQLSSNIIISDVMSLYVEYLHLDMSLYLHICYITKYCFFAVIIYYIYIQYQNWSV